MVTLMYIYYKNCMAKPTQYCKVKKKLKKNWKQQYEITCRHLRIIHIDKYYEVLVLNT